MVKEFDNQRRRKALIYTTIICSVLLLAFILISWKVEPPAPPIVQDLMEINLGNFDEGLGDVQPLIKGERSPKPETTPEPPAPQPVVNNAPEAVEEEINTDDNAPIEAAPVAKPVIKPIVKKIVTPVLTPVIKATTKPTTTAPVITPTPKPRVPKVVYNGPGSGGGNNATEDNGYKMQGNKPGGKGDAGDPNGNKDSYGTKPGGKVGGSNDKKVIKKTINRSYSFNGDLDKAVINAVIKISASGVGTFLRIGQGSTSTNIKYSIDIKERLKSIKFNSSEEDRIETVQFNFNVNQ
jgi:outer membrane biosynthesis protein TonB